MEDLVGKEWEVHDRRGNSRKSWGVPVVVPKGSGENPSAGEPTLGPRVRMLVHRELGDKVSEGSPETRGTPVRLTE